MSGSFEIREGTVKEVIAIAEALEEFDARYGVDEMKMRLASNSLILVAIEGGEMIGFKCGYEYHSRKGSFYSWMGGVVTKHRKKGVATRVLHHMESWCRINGYTSIVFKTRNRFKAMIIFALKYGFSIWKTEQSSKDTELRIWMEKKL